MTNGSVLRPKETGRCSVVVRKIGSKGLSRSVLGHGIGHILRLVLRAPRFGRCGCSGGPSLGTRTTIAHRSTARKVILLGGGGRALPFREGIEGVTLFKYASCSFVTKNANSNGIGHTCAISLLSNLGGTKCRVSRTLGTSCRRCVRTRGGGGALSSSRPFSEFVPMPHPARLVPAAGILSRRITGTSITLIALKHASNRFMSHGIDSFRLDRRRLRLLGSIDRTFRTTKGGIIIMLGVKNMVRATS